MTISTNHCGQCCLVPGDFMLGVGGGKWDNEPVIFAPFK